MSVTMDKIFDCSPDKIWEIVGNPDRVDWVPSASDCVFDGSVRRFHMEGAGKLAERIVKRDDTEMELQYSVIDSPAVVKHLATIRLISTGDGKTRFKWDQEFEPPELEPFILKGMEDSLVQLDSVLGLV